MSLPFPELNLARQWWWQNLFCRSLSGRVVFMWSEPDSCIGRDDFSRLVEEHAPYLDGRLREDIVPEWEYEPDIVAWQVNGLICLARRGTSGFWCGYLGLPGYPSGDEVFNDELERLSHGGINVGYSKDEHLPSPMVPVAHVFPGRRWLGFDCSHSNDYIPFHPSSIPESVYRNFDYVAGCLERMARRATSYAHGDVEPSQVLVTTATE